MFLYDAVLKISDIALDCGHKKELEQTEWQISFKLIVFTLQHIDLLNILI